MARDGDGQIFVRLRPKIGKDADRQDLLALAGGKGNRSRQHALQVRAIHIAGDRIVDQRSLADITRPRYRHKWNGRAILDNRGCRRDGKIETSGQRSPRYQNIGRVGQRGDRVVSHLDRQIIDCSEFNKIRLQKCYIAGQSINIKNAEFVTAGNAETEHVTRIGIVRRNAPHIRVRWLIGASNEFLIEGDGRVVYRLNSNVQRRTCLAQPVTGPDGQIERTDIVVIGHTAKLPCLRVDRQPGRQWRATCDLRRKGELIVFQIEECPGRGIVEARLFIDGGVGQLADYDRRLVPGAAGFDEVDLLEIEVRIVRLHIRERAVVVPRCFETKAENPVGNIDGNGIGELI